MKPLTVTVAVLVVLLIGVGHGRPRHQAVRTGPTDPAEAEQDARAILDVSTVEAGVEVTLVELKDIQLPDRMKRAMARQAEAEREKRAKIINAEGESLAATVVFPAPLMSTIAELSAFLARETAAAQPAVQLPAPAARSAAAGNGPSPAKRSS